MNIIPFQIATKGGEILSFLISHYMQLHTIYEENLDWMFTGGESTCGIQGSNCLTLHAGEKNLI